MTASERRQLWRSIILGLVLTALTVLADSLHSLDRPEGWLYSLRSLYCQHFAPPPTDKLIHLDIDDAALQEVIGKWPWPRDVEAKIVDELRLAGARALALDIMFPHPIRMLEGLREAGDSDPPANASAAAASSAPSTQPATHPADAQDVDAIFADALRRFGRVSLAVSLDFVDPPPPTPRHARLLDLLTHDLELTREDADFTLRKAGLGESSEDEFFATLHEAVAARVANEDPPGIEFYPVIRTQLLPTLSKFHNSIPERVLENEYYHYLALRAMQRVLPPVPPNAPPLRVAAGEKAPVPELSDAVASVGCADKMPAADGIVRFLPLWVEDRGRMVPQLGFSLACLYLGCDPRNVRIEGDSVIIPRAGATDIVIPTWRQRGEDGKIVGTMIDIPMFGTSDWQTMYDYPDHKKKSAHMPIGTVWEVVETRQRLRANNHIADTAMQTFLQQLDPAAADALKAQPLDPDNTAARLAMIREKLNDAFLKPQIEAYEKLSAKEKEADPNRASMEIITSIWDQLPDLIHQTELLQKQLAQRQAELSGQVKDKAVLIGWTATGNIDYYPTALHSSGSPGAVTHGAILNAILTNWLFTRSSRAVSFTIAALFGIVLTFVVSLSSPSRAMAAVFALILAYLLINGEFLYDYHHRIVGMAGPVVAGLLVWSNLTVARFIAEAVEHNRIRQRFRAYKDPILVNYIIEHPEISRLQGEVRLMTVGFTDLQGFTSLSETLREKAVAIVGRYMTRMVPIIRRHKGLINTFMGDGIMFSYGAPIENPDHAIDAALTVLEMQDGMKSFNAELLAEGYPQLNMRAGVNTGDVIVGDAGPEDASDYTCLGDATNFAARLESANKATGTKNLIADTTAQRLNGRFLTRPIAKLRVIGKQQSVLTWELMAEMSKATEEQKRIAAVTTIMFEHYIAGRFQEAIVAAGEMDGVCGPSKLATLYRDRCQELLANPPTEFEGNIVLENK